MIPVNYHHLYYFWTVARAGSIAAATQRLYLSQPALSGQLRQLERACNASLLERNRKGVSLTFEGRIVFERCERIFSEGDELAFIIRNGFKAPTVLRVGVQPSLSREVLLRVLGFVRRIDKSCRTAIFSGETDTLGLKLKRQELDFIITNEDCSARLGQGHRSRLVGQLPVCFVANGIVKRLIRQFPADLTKTVMLLRPTGNPVRKQVDHYLSRRRISVRVEADSDDVDLLRRLAMQGNGVAALSVMTVAADIKAGRLASLHSVAVGIKEPIWFACPHHTRSNPALRVMTDILMDTFKIPKAAITL
ncbi:MAG: LysR family transcriptional regulator [Elusimicrobiaceae bacterium]|nr:LysR family transcriptional regulator [Elusimicrobiaceae bacterium]